MEILRVVLGCVTFAIIAYALVIIWVICRDE